MKKNNLGRNKPLGNTFIERLLQVNWYCLTMQNALEQFKRNSIFFGAISRHPLYSRQKRQEMLLPGLKRHKSKHTISTSFLVVTKFASKITLQ
jgi:hypothetical protein